MQSTRTQGSNFREAYTKYILDEKDHNNQIRHCQEETGEKQNWHGNDSQSDACKFWRSDNFSAD